MRSVLASALVRECTFVLVYLRSISRRVVTVLGSVAVQASLVLLGASQFVRWRNEVFKN